MPTNQENPIDGETLITKRKISFSIKDIVFMVGGIITVVSAVMGTGYFILRAVEKNTDRQKALEEQVLNLEKLINTKTIEMATQQVLNQTQEVKIARLEEKTSK